MRHIVFSRLSRLDSTNRMKADPIKRSWLSLAVSLPLIGGDIIGSRTHRGVVHCCPGRVVTTAHLGLAALVSIVLMLAPPRATAQCANLAGSWTFSESGSVTISITASDGESGSETDPVSGTGNVTITQTGPCTFQYIPIPLNGSSWLNQNLTPAQLASLVRTVRVNGNNAQETGMFAVINYAAAAQSGITISSVNPNVYTATGQVTTNVVDNKILTMTGTGDVVVTGTGTYLGQPISFTITITATSTATLITSGSLPTTPLSVSTSGNGTVTSGDGFINCGTVCSANYVTGTAVTLTASPAQLWVFAGWTGCDTVQGNVCTVTMNNAHNVTATFNLTDALYVSTIGSGNGTVTSADGYINCGVNCYYNYLFGSTVVLTATPAQGSVFLGWNGCDTQQGNTCTVTMNKTYGRGVTAAFALTYTLSVSTVGVGVVSSADGYINCGSVCSHRYPVGTQVSLRAVPANGFRFSSWIGCDSQQGNTCTVSMYNIRSVAAYFTPLYRLTVAETGSGTVTSTDGKINCGNACQYTYDGGTSVTLTAAPAQGWALTSWSGCDATHGNVCTIAMNSDRSVTATFKITYLLSVSTTGSGIIISGDGYINCGSACSHNYPVGTTLALTAIPGIGSTLSAWSGCTSTQGNVCTIVINGTSSVSAAFSPVQITFSSLTFSPSTTFQGRISVGTLTLAAPAPSGGVTVRLTSSQPSSVYVPSPVYIRGGSSVIRFGARVIRGKPTTVTIAATDGNTATLGILIVRTATVMPPAQTFTTLVNFNASNGNWPSLSSLVQGADGNFYGTTFGGGAHGGGTVFRMTPAGTLTTLYSFAGPNDGLYPNAGLVQATDGNFYGTTSASGLNRQGTVFKITPGGALTTLHSFGGSDGAGPIGALVQATDGNFYGTTRNGGDTNCSGGCGTIFKITLGGAFSTLHSFDNNGGFYPAGGLMEARDGNLYGTTAGNGYSGSDTVFSITLGGSFTPLHVFNFYTDGSSPNGGLVQGQGTDDNLYGTAQFGRANNNCNDYCGTVFTITTTGSLTTLHSFAGTDGDRPSSGLVLGTDGNFYGTTCGGGANGNFGTVFQITSGGDLTTLHSFAGTDGAIPNSGLVQATNANLYGTTFGGGTNNNCTSGCGTVFTLPVATAALLR